MSENAREWKLGDVKREFARAYQILMDWESRPGPKPDTAMWPDYLVEYDEEPPKKRRRATPKEISNMEKVMLGFRNPVTGKQIMPWAKAYLGKRTALVKALEIFARCEAFDLTEKHEAKRFGIAYSTYRRHRDDAARIIATGLNNSKVRMF